MNYPYQNQMPTNPYVNNGYPTYAGPQYGVGINQIPKARYTQPLTPEQINQLRSRGGAFKIEVTEEDLLRAACTHKENGHPTLVVEGQNPDTGNDILHCTICGETFEMVDYNRAEVEKAVKLIEDLLQTSKALYLDIPEQLATQYYQMIPLLKMFPELYERAQKNFSMYENALGYQPNNVVAGTNGFAMMNSMLSNPYAAAGGYNMYAQQPMGYPQPMPQQQMMQQPMGYAQPQPVVMPYAQPMGNPYGNPFMTGAPQQVAPQAPTAGVVPPAPAVDQSAEVTQQKQFNV